MEVSKEIYENTKQGVLKAPLTQSQQGIYLECMMKPDSVMYNIPFHLSWEMPEGKDENEYALMLKEAVDTVISIHPALLANIKVDEDNAFMIRNDMPKDGLCTVKVTDQETLQSRLDAQTQPFDIFRGPLCRFEGFIVDRTVHLLSDMHHIISDGTSYVLLIKQIIGHINGVMPENEKLDAFSLAEVENRIKKGEAYKESEKYFEQLLSGVEIDSNIIPDFARDNSKENPCRRSDYAVTVDMDSMMKNENISPSTLFIGAFGYALAKMTGQTSSSFATVENGRKRTELLDSTVSMIVKTIPVVMDIDEENPIDMLKNTQKQFRESIANDLVSFGELVRNYGVSSDVMIVYQGEMLSGVDVDGTHVDMDLVENPDAISNISVMVFKRENNQYTFSIYYRSDLYKRETIDRMVYICKSALEAIINNRPLSEIQLACQEDIALIRKFNSKDTPYDKEETIVDVFRRHALEHPDKTVLSYKDREFTYAEIDSVTDRIAGYIADKGIGRNDTVSVLVPRNEYMMISALGVLKSGAMYEPLDPSYPEERLNFMVKDAGAKLVIADRSLVELISEYKGEIIFTDDINNIPSYDVKLEKPSAEDYFVILYTSGTTGTPKGCLLTHSNIMSFVRNHVDVMEMGSDCIVGSYASFGFDAHMADNYPAIYVGGQVCVIHDEIRLDLPAIRDYCENKKITHMVMTTQVARQFATEFSEVKFLRKLLCGGEKLVSLEPPKSYSMVNAYGPSECTVMVSSFTLDRMYDNIPIGRTLQNTHLYVVDEYGRNLPIGVPGELVASGPQVGSGYLNREEQTAKVFVPNTFEKNPDIDHMRCYKTGDIVRYLEDGNLEFIGRRDMQVKIRGFRIELSEVEKVIRDFPGIEDATVVAVDIGAEKAIHAYVVSSDTVDIPKLNSFIRSVKPSYMVPSATMQIDSIPLTVNMKVDKRKLPEINDSSLSDSTDGKRSLTNLEKYLTNMLAEIVGHERFGVETDFRDAGLSSITSIKLSVKLYKIFGVHITSKEIMDGGNILTVENLIVKSLLDRALSVDTDAKPKARLKKYPLTQSQIGIYTECLISETTGAYNIPLMLKLPKDIDLTRYKKAVVSAVKAHPSIMCFIKPDENGDVAAYPQPELEIEITEESTDISHVVATDFAFEDKPLFRFRIIRSGEDTYLFTEFHHIIFDGTSMGIIFDDIDAVYRGENLKDEEYTIYDMAVDEAKARNGRIYEGAKAYYDSVFRGMSGDYLPYPDVHDADSMNMHQEELTVSLEKVSDSCDKYDVTENVIFSGAFGILLSRFTSHDDAIFATVHNGRNDPRTARMTTMLVKTLPIYISAADDMGMADYFRNIEEHLRLLKNNDIYSFADAAHDFGLNADVMFIYQGNIIGGWTLDGNRLTAEEVSLDSAKAQISMEVYKNENGYSTKIEYNAGRYSADWVESFADAYNICVKNMLEADLVGDVEITSEKALEKFADFNDTYFDIPYRPAYRLIEESADRFPDKKAVVAAGESITYLQLDHMANRLAELLLEKGVEQGSSVEIIVNRTKEIYVAETGILKAGCGFLFMSPDYPDERIRYVSADARVKAIVTVHDIYEKRQEFLDGMGVPLIFADDIPTDSNDERLSLDVDPSATSYMIFTSGSTGKPKGVDISQRNLVNFAVPTEKNEQVGAYVRGHGVSTAVTTFSFDASIVEGYIALANGLTVCIAGDEEIHNPVAFTELCLKNGVTSVLGTPSLLLSLIEYEGFKEAAQNIKCVVAGGENFQPAIYERLKSANPDMVIINGYGPSEATVSCSYKVLESPENITIGAPLTNTEMFIIDRKNHILPMGALGEMIILGAGVGKGYLNRKDLTEKVFIELNGKPAYKTGDLAIITHDGELEYHGRIDNQVKLRGLRVELGEIENAITSCDGVTNTIVVVKGEGNNQFLVGYYTADEKIDPGKITAHISTTLTDYMVPKILLQLDEMPLNANGKIDKKALPEPDIKIEKREYIAPQTDVEKKLCDAFASTLNIEKVGVTDNFFELGGTSLTATKIAMFAMSHNLPVVYADVFKYSSVKELAALSEGKMSISDETNDTAAVSGISTSENIDSKNDECVGERVSGASDAEYDYSDINRILARNVWNVGDDPGNRMLGNVLLTGSTGFLGMHMLKTLLDYSDSKIYCLIRKGKFNSMEMKLQNIFYYYFEESLEDTIGNRVICINGDITDETEVMNLEKLSVDTVINCAACVKHFSNSDILQKVNVEGVRNLVKLCMKTGSRLVHISTISVAGEGVDGKPDQEKRMKENELFFSQLMENQYIATKFEAEKIILQAVSEGLDAKIMRAGNLMPRRSDGEFQINNLTNGFMRRLRGYSSLGCIPYSALSAEMEFSPIDETAQVMLRLAKTDSRFTVFHTNNTHRVFMSDVVRVMNDAEIKIDAVSEDEFATRMERALADSESNEAVSGLIAYVNRDNFKARYMIDYDNSLTSKVLNRIGYSWMITDDAYVRKAIVLLKDQGFFGFGI